MTKPMTQAEILYHALRELTEAAECAGWDVMAGNREALDKARDALFVAEQCDLIRSPDHPDFA